RVFMAQPPFRFWRIWRVCWHGARCPGTWKRASGASAAELSSAFDPFCQMHHHCSCKEGRGKIQDRDPHEGGDDQAGKKDRPGMTPPQLPRGILAQMTHRGKFEEFPAKEIAIDEEEGGNIDPWN